MRYGDHVPLQALYTFARRRGAIVTAAWSRHYVRVIGATGVAGAWAGDAVAIFRVPDPAHRLAGVRLRPDVRIAGDLLDFRRIGAEWELVIGRPPVSRMEYLVELRYSGGSNEIVPHPGNPRQVEGSFGTKSVLEFPSYAPPGWLMAPAELRADVVSGRCRGRRATPAARGARRAGVRRAGQPHPLPLGGCGRGMATAPASRAARPRAA